MVLAGQDAKHLFEFLERRVGAADDFAQVAAAPRQAGAQLVEDDRQPLAFGQSVDVAEQVDVNRTVSVLYRQQPLARSFVPGADLLEGRRQRRACDAGLSREAIDVLLADQRLRAHRAAGVGAKVLEAGLGDFQQDCRLRLRRGSHRADRADLDPVDLDVLAGDDVAGVVEERPNRVSAVRAAC